jgi:hypothetical protein
MRVISLNDIQPYDIFEKTVTFRFPSLCLGGCGGSVLLISFPYSLTK